MHPAVSYNVLDEIGGGRTTAPIGQDYMRIRAASTATSSSCESSAGAQRRRPSGMSQHSTQDDRPMSTFGRDDGVELGYRGGKRVNSAYSHGVPRNHDTFR